MEDAKLLSPIVTERSVVWDRHHQAERYDATQLHCFNAGAAVRLGFRRKEKEFGAGDINSRIGRNVGGFLNADPICRLTNT